jgi:hypothetical protein
MCRFVQICSNLAGVVSASEASRIIGLRVISCGSVRIAISLHMFNS